MRTLLICHEGAALDREGLGRWLGSFSHLAGTIVIRETAATRRRRLAREIRRVGWLRFLDVLAFRAYHAAAHARADRQWEHRALESLRAQFPTPPVAPQLLVASPNAAAAERFIADRQPDLVIARCKTLLAERIFSLPSLGTFVMHPGICPEYRNAHGCFWALATGDTANVGMTLLRIDRGVDTGPVFGYFRIDGDLSRETHVVTQHRVVLEHLDAIRETLLAVAAGRATPISTAGRQSRAWGQPWLTSYLRARSKGRTRLQRRAAGSW
jgi:hypothetical protein